MILNDEMHSVVSKNDILGYQVTYLYTKYKAPFDCALVTIMLKNDNIWQGIYLNFVNYWEDQVLLQACVIKNRKES